MSNYKNKFKFLCEYDASKGGLLMEAEGRYMVIGHIKDSNVRYATGDYYVLVDTTVPKSDNINQYAERAIVYNSKEDGSGIVLPHYKELENFITILPEYKNSYYAHAIFGEPEDIKSQKSEELFATIQQENGIAILTHNSSKKITDGYIKIGMTPNDYSASDFKGDNTPRAYFWGSPGGMDISGSGATYIYTCELPMNKIYDIKNNINHWDSKEAVENGYVATAYYMSGEKRRGTVVVSYVSLPIKTIRVAMDSGKVYNAEWQLIN